MRRTRDLPQPEPLVVGLTSREVGERPEHVRFALHHQDRHAYVVADAISARETSAPDRCVDARSDSGGVPSLDRNTRAGAALQQERVEHLNQRIDRVDVGREIEGRLRRTGRDHTLHPQAVALGQHLGVGRVRSG